MIRGYSPHHHYLDNSIRCTMKFLMSLEAAYYVPYLVAKHLNFFWSDCMDINSSGFSCVDCDIHRENLKTFKVMSLSRASSLRWLQWNCTQIFWSTKIWTSTVHTHQTTCNHYRFKLLKSSDFSIVSNMVCGSADADLRISRLFLWLNQVKWTSELLLWSVWIPFLNIFWYILTRFKRVVWNKNYASK